jgi:site-specific recombinase XerD
MTTALSVIVDSAAPLPALPAADLDRAANFARQDKAPATRAAYKSGFAAFQKWCARRGVASLPATPETVAGFLAAEAEAGLKPATIGRRGAAISYAHKFAGHEPPPNHEAVSAARRGASVFKMRDVSRHKSMDVLQAYVRDADLFRDHAGAGLL